MRHRWKRGHALGALLLLGLPGCGGDARERGPEDLPKPAPARAAQPRVAVAPGAVPVNLLLVTMDTTRADRLGCYGYERGSTPHLDRPAARGRRFEQAIAPVALTRPSHATMFTGQLPQTHGVWSNGPYRLEPGSQPLAERLQAAGFDTGAVVASFVLARTFGFESGFARYDDSAREIEGGDPEKTADEVVAVAAGWLENEFEPPFFLWVHFYDPHVPYTPPEPYGADPQVGPYDGEISFMDDAIGRLLAILEAGGRLAETLVVAVADHGEGLGEHGETTHGYFLYDNSLRVPLIMAGPGVPSAHVVEQQVTLADLAPTLLDAFGLEPGPLEVDGRSFWRELGRREVTARPALVENRAIHDQYGWAALSGLRSGGWKWIRAPEPELYDLAADPAESRNLALSERQRAAELRSEWRRLRRAGPPRQSGGLSAEEERKLAALGYLAAPPSDSSLDAGVDPKRVASSIADIEALIDARRAGREEESEELAESILATDPSNLFALRVKAQRLLARRQDEAAARLLERIVDGHETHPETLADLAQAYERMGRSGDALARYRQATTPPWIYWPALGSLARISARQPGLLPRADLLATLDGFEPPAPRERLELARAYALAAAWPAAERWFRAALETDPGLVEASVGLAQVMTRQGRHDEALSVLTAVAPPTVESVYVEALILQSLGRRPEACGGFAAAMDLEPRNANLLFGLGAALARCDSPELARRALRRTLEREPGYVAALYELARLEKAAGRPGEARELFRRLLPAAPPRMEAERRAAQAGLRELGG